MNRRGATAIEYGILATLIAVAIIAGLTSLSGVARWKFLYLALIFGGIDGDGCPDTPEFMSAIFDYAHGGDELVSMSEWKGFRYQLPNFLEDHPPTDESLEWEFNEVDGRGNDNDLMEYDEWMDLMNIGGPPD